MTASARFLTASAKAVYFLSAVCYNAVNLGKQLKGADIMKKHLRIMLAAALAAFTFGGCNNSPAPTGEDPVTSGNAAVNTTTAGTSDVPETTAEDPFTSVVEGEPLPGIDWVQSNFGTKSLDLIMEIDEGYYYNSLAPDTLSLHFHDNASGKTIYLCAKPECTHDGNDFCPATARRYKPCSTVLYGDKIYMSVHDTGDKDNLFIKLIAADRDGTSLSEIAEVVRIKGSNKSVMINTVPGNHQGMVIHRGKALVPYTLYGKESGSDGTYLSGFAIIDIATGNVEYREETEDNILSFFTAAGNAFYYRASVDTTQVSSYDTSSFYDVRRYDIKEKKSRKLNVYDSYIACLGRDGSEPKQSVFAVADGKIYFSTGDTSGTTCGVFIYDMTTGKTREFTELDEIQFERYDKDGELYYETFRTRGDDITYDGKYLYISKNEGLTSRHTSHDPQCYVIDTNGKYYGKIEYKFDGYYGLYAMNFLNGNVYIQTDEKVVYCAVEELLGGNEDWREAYTFEDVEYKSRY